MQEGPPIFTVLDAVSALLWIRLLKCKRNVVLCLKYVACPKQFESLGCTLGLALLTTVTIGLIEHLQTTWYFGLVYNGCSINR